MRIVNRCLLSLAAVVVAAAWLPAQQGRALTHADYDQWKSLRGTTYTQDGSWVAYSIDPQWGDGVLEVREVNGSKLYRHEFASNPHFTTDGRFVVFTLGKSKVAERDKKIEELRKKAKEANKPAAEGNSKEAKEPKEASETKAGAGEPASGGGGSPRRGGGGRRPSGAGGAAGAGGAPNAAPGGDDAAARERGELCVLDLATGAVEKLGKVKGSTVSDDLPFLLYHRDKPTPKPRPKADGEAGGEKPEEPNEPNEPAAAGEGETKSETQPEVAAASEKPSEKPANKPTEQSTEQPTAKPTEQPNEKPSTRRDSKPKDPLEAKRPEGTELVVRDLATGHERTIADVVAYGLSGKGKWLWFHTSHKQPQEGVVYGLFVQPLAGGTPVQLLDGVAHVGSVTIDRDETAIAFTSDLQDFAADKPQNDLYVWDGGAAPAVRAAYAGASGMPAKKRVAGSLSWSRDGSALEFAINDAPAADPLPILPEDKVTLDLWNWRDGQLQTQQSKRGNGEANPEWSAFWFRADRRLAVLGDDNLRSLRFVGHGGQRLLGTDGSAYERESTWDGRYVDVWLVDSNSGQRTRVLERLRGNVSTSPNGRFMLWFSPDYHWWSLDVATGERRDLTGALAVPFHRHDDDHPEPDSPYGLGGWTKDDGAVLVYDEFDVWKIVPATGDAVCVTEGAGRAQRLRLRIEQLPRPDDRDWVDDELLLTATNVDTMAEGFFADSLTRRQKPQRLLLDDANLAGLTRQKHGSRLFFTRSTFATFPDLWTADADFGNARRLTDANPQQSEYRWGKSELVHWVDGDGRPRQGVLIKPDGFDPKQHYPMMVHFYERMTPGLHSYSAPAPGTSPNAAYYVSNGWLWFMPDVVYEVGYPGNSCVKCVVSGVQHLLAQGFVDPRGIAASGHSWGGYQTAFLVTRTNIFKCVESGAPVSNMLSAYGGIRYESGVSRQFQYEMTQSRIGGTPWQYPLRYQENSPIWFADKVNTPVLILHNDQDGAVPWTQGIEYLTALRRLGKESYLFNYNGEGHGLRNRANMKDWSRRMAEYFEHHCRGAAAPKWMDDGVPFHARDGEKLPFAQSYIDAHVKPAPERAAPAAVPAAVPAVAVPSVPVEAAASGENGSSNVSGEPAVEPAVENAREPAGEPALTPSGASSSSSDGVRESRRRGRSSDSRTRTAQPAAMKLQRGDRAPDFAIADHTGTVQRLADYRGRMLLIWFYPKASTPGCTTQGCGLRDEFARFRDNGTAILGVSVDDRQANAAFQQQHELPFPLLCDTERTMAIAYGACDDEKAHAARRIAVLIDGDGKVVQVWSKVDTRTFAAQALQALPL